MSEIPYDLDPSLFFSDYLPSDNLEDPSAAFPTPPIESYSDDFEALDLVKEERRSRLTEEGVVIQHRQRDTAPVFRSSSLPPATPTRKGVGRTSQFRYGGWSLSEAIASDTVSSPSQRTPRARTRIEESMTYPRSSPPLEPTSPPAAKKRKTTLAEDDNDNEGFDYPDSDEEEALIGLEDASNLGDNDSQNLPPTLPEQPAAALKPPPLKPVFNLRLSSGIFSRKFSALESSSYHLNVAERDAEKRRMTSEEVASILGVQPFRPDVTPPPQLPSPDVDKSNSFVPSSQTNFTSSTSTPSAVHTTTQSYTYISIVTTDGEKIQVKQGPKKIFSARDDYYMSSVPILGDNLLEQSDSVKKIYFGVDIHNLLDEYKIEKDIMKKNRREAGHIPPTNVMPENSNTASQKTLLWTEKYRAKRFTDLVGDERTHRQVLRWFKSWDMIVFPSGANKPAKNRDESEDRELRKILLIHGPPGLGKTTLAHVVARQAGYDVVEVNASDERSAGVVKGRIKDILSNEGVKAMGAITNKTKQSSRVTMGKPVCLVIDEIDGVTGSGGAGANEGGFIKALIDLVLADQKLNNIAEGVTKKQSHRKGDSFKLLRPIVAVCNDLYVPALKALRPLAEIVHMRKPPVGPMVGRLKSILEYEGFRTEDGAVRRLVELSCMGGNSTSKAAGDMRAAVVGCEWIASRLRSAATKCGDDTRSRREMKLLTRKIVEEEFGDGGLGEGDGKGGGGGRGNIREAVERVFYNDPATKRAGFKDTGVKRASGEKLREIVEGLGEFDKIMMDCFTTYPTRPYNDDSLLTKPNAASEWLYFSDLISSRVFQGQEYELTGYLSQPILAFHSLFCSPRRQESTTGRYGKQFEEEIDPSPFSGPAAEWEVREGMKENTSLIQNVHSCLGGIRLHQCFKSPESVAMELAPWVARILSPSIKPVVVGGSGPTGGIASVRREGEKKLVNRGVEVMCGMGVEFEKVRVEGMTTLGSGWIYRMEPPIDTLSVYPTLATSTESAPAPVRYAVRQVLDQEHKKELLRRRELARQSRMGVSNDVPQLKKPTTTPDSLSLKRKKVREIKKDFFGRIVAREEDEDTEEGRRKKRKEEKDEKEEEQKVWLSFHEGFSNAVRKGITLDELMSGLM